MKTEIKTALILGAAVAIGIGALGVALTTLDSQALPVDTKFGTPADKSGFKTAPDLVGIAHYINTTPESLAAKMEDSVVMYDIWTYSCINCIRTLPYITAWDEKYAEYGLLIIGVHSPEFEFEKDPDNVRRAVTKHNIDYPVVMDNDKDTWKAFENRYWPRKYIADHEGYIRYDHIGEGRYGETERVIQQLLAERAAALGAPQQSLVSGTTVEIEEFEHTLFRTPELYLGYHFAQNRNNLGSEEGFKPGQTVTYGQPASVSQDKFYMAGKWKNNYGSMGLADDSGGILLKYSAKEVNIVTEGKSTIEVLIDGSPVAAGIAGHDVDPETGMLVTDEPRLYNIISADAGSTHEMELRITGEGFEIFTFTFG